MFIDEARIRVKAGDGGNGCMAFRREKFVPRGGPSGGDGGHGGDILMESSLSHNTLVHFRFNPEHKSQRGGHGLGSNCSGYSGEHLTLKVPVGTVLYDDETGEQIHDFTRAGDSIVIARGGRGGRGNQHFATSTHQAPREHELGRAGEERNYRLELRLLADAGLVGYPNVGKSTLISRISAAKPKIANYAFTTLEPNLGVVSVGDWPHEQSFTIADLPGLIEGASEGAGLGIQFLNAELKAFDPALAAKPTLIVAAKIDVANPDKLKKLRAFAKRRKSPFYEISSVAGTGIEALKYAIAELVQTHRPVPVETEAPPPKKRKPAYPPLAASARGRA
jgi:GTP-binding protein